VNSGAFFDTGQLGPSTRVVETGRPCTRAVYTGSGNRPLVNVARMHDSTSVLSSLYTGIATLITLQAPVTVLYSQCCKLFKYFWYLNTI